jgi:hypothetical protein
MRNPERSIGHRFSRRMVIVLGVLSGFAAFDAILLFLLLLLAGVFVQAPNPYIGILAFVALPIVAIVGGTFAWMAFMVLQEGPPASTGDTRHAHV